MGLLKIFMTATVLLAACWAHADNHSDILIANAQMAAVAKHAVQEAGHDYRVIGIKVIGICGAQSLFELSIGALNPATGQNHVAYTDQVTATSPVIEKQVTTDPAKVVVSGPNTYGCN
jgi:hypothetical protein